MGTIDICTLDIATLATFSIYFCLAISLQLFRLKITLQIYKLIAEFAVHMANHAYVSYVECRCVCDCVAVCVPSRPIESEASATTWLHNKYLQCPLSHVLRK